MNNPETIVRLVRAICELRALGSDTDRQLGLVEICSLLNVPFLRDRPLTPEQVKAKPDSTELDFSNGERHALVGRGLIWIRNGTEFRIRMRFDHAAKEDLLIVEDIEPMPGHLWPE